MVRFHTITTLTTAALVVQSMAHLQAFSKRRNRRWRWWWWGAGGGSGRQYRGYRSGAGGLNAVVTVMVAVLLVAITDQTQVIQLQPQVAACGWGARGGSGGISGYGHGGAAISKTTSCALQNSGTIYGGT